MDNYVEPEEASSVKEYFSIIGVGCGEGIEPFVLSLDKHHR